MGAHMAYIYMTYIYSICDPATLPCRNQISGTLPLLKYPRNLVGLDYSLNQVRPAGPNTASPRALLVCVEEAPAPVSLGGSAPQLWRSVSLIGMCGSGEGEP